MDILITFKEPKKKNKVHNLYWEDDVTFTGGFVKIQDRKLNVIYFYQSSDIKEMTILLDEK